MKILIVDDEPATRLLLSRLLMDLGYETLLAENGEQGLALYQAEPEARLVFLDWHMPVASGIEMINAMRSMQSGPLPYVVMMTTVANSDVVLAAFNAGVHDCLPKPIEANHVWARVKTAERFLSLGLQESDLMAERIKDYIRNSEIRTVNHMVHEVSTPLATAKLAVNLLRAEITSATLNSERYLKKIDLNIQRAVDILRNQQRRLSVQRSSFQTIDLVALLRDAVTTTCFEWRHMKFTLRSELVEETIPVLANPTELFQVFTNLLKNALEAVQAHTAPWIQIGLERDTEWVRVRIGDCGKSPGVLPTRSTKGKGHYGIGLAVCQTLLKEHGGALTLNPNSELTEFIVLLPLSPSD